MTEKNLELVQEDSKVKRKVFNVMVECLQNIVKHSETMQESKYEEQAVFMIGRDGEEYLVITGNYMYTENIPILKGKIEQVNSLDKDGLKKLYKEPIKSTQISEKGGAGLGFIDIARKSGSKIDYDFKEIDSEFSFFTMMTKISKAKPE